MSDLQISSSELFEFRAALLQAQALLAEHEKDLAELKQQAERNQDSDKRVESSLGIMTDRLATLKANFDESRSYQRNLWYGVLGSLLISLMSKLIAK
jgi:chromosome segregation ATPase